MLIINDMKKFEFNYEPELTGYLDNIGTKDISDVDILKITLWKVARYPHVPLETLSLFNELRGIKDINRTNDRKKAEEVLKLLLQCKGVRLPMASTYLRFRNPNVFQIIDRHVWYQVYGDEYVESNKVDEQITKYFKYLEDLRIRCNKDGIKFFDADRYYYLKDKEEGHKIGK